jgi:hypothetical protein
MVLAGPAKIRIKTRVGKLGKIDYNRLLGSTGPSEADLLGPILLGHSTAIREIERV